MAISLQRALCPLLWIIIAGQQSVTTLCGDGTKLEFLSGEPHAQGHDLPAFSANSGFRGAVSCSASSCHGGPLPGVEQAAAGRGSEYSLWMNRDPHARSWRTLCSKQSLAILEKLDIIRDGRLVNLAAYNNCLSCHNTTKLDGNLSPTGKVAALSPIHAEGVGCEACHGPSEKWYSHHFQPSFSHAASHGDDSRLAGELVDLSSHLQRAKRCAQCHVGAEDRDMNHDLIAAGHPALYFEYAAYHEQLPKHWREPSEDSHDRRAKMWLAGQLATAQAELELTIARSAQTHSVSVWPELSTFQCSACHQSLQSPSSTGQASSAKASFQASQLSVAGELTPRRWNLGGVRVAAMASHAPAKHTVTEMLEKFERTLQASGMRPDQASRVAVSTQARVLAESLQRFEQVEMKRTFESWNSHRQAEVACELLSSVEVAKDWEFACRAYSSAWSTGVTRSTAFNKSLELLRERLLFTVGTQSSSFPSRHSQSAPADGEAWRQALETCVRELEKMRL